MKNERIIYIETPDGTKKYLGICITSKLQWSDNIEGRVHYDGGLCSTKQVPTDYFEEIWDINDKQIKLSKFIKNENKTKTIYYVDQEAWNILKN